MRDAIVRPGWRKMGDGGVLRSVGAIALGLAVAVLLILLLQWAGFRLFPLPPTLQLNEPAQWAHYWAGAPRGALLMVLLSYAFGACDGAILAAWLSPQQPWRHAALVVALVALLALLNVLSVAYPDWFVWSLLPVFLSALLVGGKIGAMLHDRRRAGILR
ncbi:MAG: hypothetical protein ACK4E7_09480 [Permianibacter sp.]